MIKKIAITGPESTGKSALCQSLAVHYKTLWVPEYARAYLSTLKLPYKTEDVENIARGQMLQEKQMTPNAKGMLFCDTELLVIKIWFNNSFGYCPEWVIKALDEQHYDLYLLCDIDLPWEYDPLREHPHKRMYFFNLFKKELEERQWPFFIVSGIGERRTLNALEAVKRLVGFIDF